MRLLRPAKLGLFAALGLFQFGVQMPAAQAKPCKCVITRAASDAPTGVCDVREYQSSCELIWGPEPGAKQSSLSVRPPTATVMTSLMHATAQAKASGTPPPSGPVLPPIERIANDPNFWREFQGTVENKVPMDADLYARSLAFLAQQGYVVEQPHIAVGAVLFVIAAGLVQHPSPQIRLSNTLILEEFIRVRQQLAGFTQEKALERAEFQWQFPIAQDNGQVKSESGPGFVVFGCAEYLFGGRFAQLVKTPWSVAPSGRCRP